ncbi:hypothetical protein RZS08_02470, partial [Arthrospira platensis SPKY1]|nr:hypothetical protein [Arthrospira platensis SPKY1]
MFHVQTGLTPANLSQDPMRETQLAVGTRPDAQVIAELPVIGVVPAAVPGSGVGGHLVAFHP